VRDSGARRHPSESRGRCQSPRGAGVLLAGVLLVWPCTLWPGPRQGPPPAKTREAAIAAFRQNDLERAERLSTAWLEAHPRDVEIVRLLGMVRITTGLALEADGRPREEYLAVYRQALDALLRAEKLGEGRTQPDLNHAVGYILMIEGRYEPAAARLTRAITETPGNFVLYRLRGNCRLELGQYLEAEEDLRRAVELNPRDWTSRVLHARALHLVGQGQAARAGLREYLHLVEDELSDERLFAVRYEIYRYSMLLNDTEAARADLERACPIEPSNLVCRTELGTLYYRLGLAEKAIPEFDAVLAAPRAPEALRGDALHYRGLIARQQEDYELARQYLAEALELQPTRSDALLNYGAVLRALGEKEEARRVLKRFQEVVAAEKDVRRLTDRLLLDPSEREARVELIEIMIDLGRWSDARTQLDELRQRHPGDPAIPDLEKRIPSADEAGR
jgi:tetratricopeptide (TPR) repeat protein